MSTDFKYVISEINKYSSGIHLLNAGVDEPLIQIFEKKYNICIPALYKQWLKMFNGGEFFALPVGTSFAGMGFPFPTITSTESRYFDLPRRFLFRE